MMLLKLRFSKLPLANEKRKKREKRPKSVAVRVHPSSAIVIFIVFLQLHSLKTSTMIFTHAISWFEIPTEDIDRAQRFYETIFGITMVPVDLAQIKMRMF